MDGTFKRLAHFSNPKTRCSSSSSLKINKPLPTSPGNSRWKAGGRYRALDTACAVIYQRQPGPRLHTSSEMLTPTLGLVLEFTHHSRRLHRRSRQREAPALFPLLGTKDLCPGAGGAGCVLRDLLRYTLVVWRSWDFELRTSGSQPCPKATHGPNPAPCSHLYVV